MKLSPRWFWSLLAHNFLWKLLALIIAVCIWAVVEVEPEVATSVTVLMQYGGLPDEFEISGLEPANNTVTLEIRGPSGALRGLCEPGGPRVGVVLDMSGARPGTSTYMIGNGNLRLARGLRMVRAIPSEARVELDRRAIRAVPVTVRFRGDGENGYEVAHYAVSPAKLEIAGPASHVERVGAAVTDPVDVAGARGTAEFPVNTFVSDAYVRFRTPPTVVVTVTMKRK
jgi:YbbR domain-containing protein